MTDPSRSKPPVTLNGGSQEENEGPRRSWSLPSSIDVLAGAGAAATSTLIGGELGVAGTVIGAAVASAVTTIALSLYKNVFGAGREVLGKAKGSAQRNLVTTIAATGARPDAQQQLDQTILLERVDPTAGSESAAGAPGAGADPEVDAGQPRRTFSRKRVIVSVTVTALLALIAGLALVLGVQGFTGRSVNEGNAGLQQQVEKAIPGSRASSAEPSEPASAGTAVSSTSATSSASAKATSTSTSTARSTATPSGTAAATQAGTATGAATQPTQAAQTAQTAPVTQPAEPTAPVASRIAPTHTGQPTAAAS